MAQYKFGVKYYKDGRYHRREFTYDDKKNSFEGEDKERTKNLNNLLHNPPGVVYSGYMPAIVCKKPRDKKEDLLSIFMILYGHDVALQKPKGYTDVEPHFLPGEEGVVY